jgi:hypothetical protein
MGIKGHSDIAYSSNRHLALCYAKMVKRPVTPEEIANCFLSRFNDKKQNRTSMARNVIKKNADHGYMKKVDEDAWQITETGVQKVYAVAQSHKSTRNRVVGLDFMKRAERQLAECAKSPMQINLNEVDREDQILEQIYMRYIKIVSERTQRRLTKRSEQQEREAKEAKKMVKATRKR